MHFVIFVWRLFEQLIDEGEIVIEVEGNRVGVSGMAMLSVTCHGSFIRLRLEPLRF